MIDSAGDYVARAREMVSIGDRITNKAPFVPPVNGELTPSQVDRFIAVQGRVRSDMGDRWGQIEAKSAEIQRRTQNNKTDLSLTEVASVFSDLANIYIEARKVQVNALNVHKFSDDEYSWVRRRVYEAAGVQLAHGIDMSRIEDIARSGAQKGGMNIPDMPDAGGAANEHAAGQAARRQAQRVDADGRVGFVAVNEFHVPPRYDGEPRYTSRHIVVTSRYRLYTSGC